MEIQIAIFCFLEQYYKNNHLGNIHYSEPAMAIIVTQSSVRYFTNKLNVFVKLIVKLKID